MYSEYQLAIFDELKNGTGHLMVNAVAGSGKTFTCEKAIKEHISQVYSTLFTCFGRDIAAEISKRAIPGTIGTYNSLGWRLLRKVHKTKIEEDKTKLIYNYKIKGQKSHLQNVIRLVSLLKGSLARPTACEAQIEALCKRHSIPFTPELCDLTAKTFLQSVITTHIMDYDDQIFMPIHLDLTFPAFDYVFVDEFQDTNDAQAEMMRRMSRMGRFIGVGDPDQAIYGFRGATPDAFEAFRVAMKAKEMPLSICYRCSKAVVREAQKIVPRIRCVEGQVEGSVDICKPADLLNVARDGDIILCRTVAPLIKNCLQAIKRNIRASVLGREVKDNLLDTMGEFDDMDSGDFVKALDQYVLEKCARWESMGYERAIDNLLDVQEALHAVAEMSDDTRHMAFTINELFSHEGGLRFMSVHKSKGLEADNVYILHPELMPHPKAKDVAEEKRIKYVATTRAKFRLYWVSGS